jgi:hypothetical protein
MKKLLLLVAIVSTFSFASYAEGMKLGLWTGYASVSMSDLNKGASTKSSNGLIIGADYDYSINDNFSVGPRISYLSANQGKANYEYNSYYYDYYGYSYTSKVVAKETYDPSLTSIMVGGKYKREISDKIDVNGAIYVGYGIGTVKDKLNLDWYYNNVLLVSSSYNDNLDGNCVTADLSVGGEYKLNDMLSIGLNLGYTLAKINKVKNDAGYTIVKNDNGDKLSVDFSGIRLTTGVNLKF